MNDIELAQQLLQTGMVPHFPYLVVTQNNGQLRMELVKEKEFDKRMHDGTYVGKILLARLPKQDACGRWIGVPKNALFVFKGVIMATPEQPNGLN